MYENLFVTTQDVEFEFPDYVYINGDTTLENGYIEWDISVMVGDLGSFNDWVQSKKEIVVNVETY